MKLQESSERYNIILDAKVLKLLLIGLYDNNVINKYCKDYNEDNFNSLMNFIKIHANKIIVTSYLLAEVSNHLENSSSSSNDFEKLMENILKHIQKMKEISIGKEKLIREERKCLCKFGFADASIFDILEKSRNYTILITTDNPLFYYCINKEIKAWQFPFSFPFQ